MRAKLWVNLCVHIASVLCLSTFTYVCMPLLETGNVQIYDENVYISRHTLNERFAVFVGVGVANFDTRSTVGCARFTFTDFGVRAKDTYVRVKKHLIA